MAIEKGDMVDNLNCIMKMDPEDVMNYAHRKLSSQFPAGCEEWLLWEAVWNLARKLNEVQDHGGE